MRTITGASEMVVIFYLLAAVAIVRFALTGIVPEKWFRAIDCAGYWCAKVTCVALVLGAVLAVGVAFWPHSEPLRGIESASAIVVPPLERMAPAGR